MAFWKWIYYAQIKNLFLKGHKSTIFHWIHWGNHILANAINYGVKILWQILTINKRREKNLTDFPGISEWSISEWSISVRSHKCRKVTSHSLGLSKYLLEPGDMMVCCARQRWPVVLGWGDLLRSYTIFSPCLESPTFLGSGTQYLDKVLWLLPPALQRTM